jgi:hypothetical protein
MKINTFLNEIIGDFVLNPDRPVEPGQFHHSK